jgi:DNA repair protein RadC
VRVSFPVACPARTGDVPGCEEDEIMTTLYIRDGEIYREADGREVLDKAQAIIAQRYRPGAPAMTSPERTAEFLKLKLGGLDHEVFGFLGLDARHRLIQYVELFRGTIDGAAVYPREVVKEALRLNCAALVLVHGHPSGNSSPSQADELITRRLREALALVDIRVLDHLIVGDSVSSFCELGLL